MGRITLQKIEEVQMNLLKITGKNGARGIEISGSDGVDIRIIRERSGVSSIEIKKYDEEGNASSMAGHLNREETKAVVEVLESKLHAMKKPKELFNKETAR